MNSIALLLIPSVLAIITLPIIVNRRLAAYWSATLATFSFLVAIPLIIKSYEMTQPIFFLHQWLFCDKLSAFFVGLNTLITMTTCFYAISYLNNEPQEKLHGLIYRFYHMFFHIFTLSMLLVTLSNNIGFMWIAMELATISSVVLVGLYQTPEALEAAWKYLILCGVGIGLALLGTVIIYFAAHPYLPGEQGLLWTSLLTQAPHFSSKLLAVAFVFLFIGYGTKVGFFPLHNWLPDAHAEGPSPISALLSGLLLNIALLAILRFKLILDYTTLAHFVSFLLLLFGFINLLFAALSLLRQRELKRLFAYSSIEHMGLISIALGLGTPLAYLAGFLHILMHSLSKTAAFLSSGAIIQRFHTQTMSQLKGLSSSVPISGWCILLSSFIILGMPPSGLFFSEILLILATLETHFWLLIPLLLGLGISFLAIFSRIQSVVFSAHPTPIQPLHDTQHLSWPVILHLVLAISAGLWIPLFFIQPVITLLMQGT